MGSERAGHNWASEKFHVINDCVIGLIIFVPFGQLWLPTNILPGKSHGQRSLVGYSPWGHKELDTTEQNFLSFFLTRNTGIENIYCNFLVLKLYVVKTYTLPYVKQIASGNLLYVTGSSNLVLCDNLEGGMGWEVGGEFKMWRDMYIPVADSCWCMAETNTTS